MTKDSEIALLDRTIATFGPSSYLGPWLSEYRAVLVADIRNDITPSAPLPSVARAEASLVLETARAEASAIRTAATRTAAAELETARAECRELRENVRTAVSRFLQYL